ncbi:hypothetical protein [Xanthomonas sp. LMG 12459]|uniref:hypothetical protein n=1 Tax=Xanthomonas sp. LMG 12459 TaxID=1591131 RepID=UPI001262FDC0|nr:hypothetical protein [Xanthomonas sp. LMG 12459]
MKSRLRKVLGGMMISAILAACQNSEVEKALPSRCSKKDNGHIICVPTIRDLAMSPNEYDEKEIIVSGFLVIDRGQLSLYSSDLDYKHSLSQDNVIILRGSEARQEKAFDDFAYKYIRISGTFHGSKYPPSKRYEIGDLEIEDDAYELPDRSDPSSRQGWKDVRIDVRDIAR